ncbi:MAG TPA: cupin domain-containing protein [Nitrospirae bacterium]|nr:cupin domain protein [bacterium BMS3Abin10]GBE39409.1 cupin domain protein [bacterium BMS3Bbin08]HDK82472.1 cupin domain-containing protein [Nitrospirota bacterium]HDO26446.1 cupin domain-containing protein [Nitrospirota bacterium]
MKHLILDLKKLKKFSDDKPHKEPLWKGDTSGINLIGLKPGQEIKPHVHKGDHIWIILEGCGEFLTGGGGSQAVYKGNIAIVPAGEEHGIKNHTNENLVFASITA